MINKIVKGHITARDSQKGMSLVELLVAVLFLGILVLVLSQSLITTIRSNFKAEVQKEIKENGDYAIEYMGRIVRNGRSINVDTIECRDGATVTGTTLEIINPDDTSVVIVCGESGKITVGGSAITSESVEVSICSATCTSQSFKPSIVTVNFTLKQAGDPPDIAEQATQHFSSTYSLRNK